MADPLSIAAGVAGLASLALDGTRKLLDDLQRIKDAPSVVDQLKGDIQSTQVTLKAIKHVSESEWNRVGDGAADQAKNDLKMCETACENFSRSLQKWTKYSRDGSLSWISRGTIGLFKQKQIQALSSQLQRSVACLQFMINCASFLNSVRDRPAADAFLSAGAVQRDEIVTACVTTTQQLVAVEDDLRSVDSIEADDNDDDFYSARKQLEAEIASLKASQELLNNLIGKLEKKELEHILSPASSASNVANVSVNGNNHGFVFGNYTGAYGSFGSP